MDQIILELEPELEPKTFDFYGKSLKFQFRLHSSALGCCSRMTRSLGWSIENPQANKQIR